MDWLMMGKHCVQTYVFLPCIHNVVLAVSAHLAIHLFSFFPCFDMKLWHFTPVFSLSSWLPVPSPISLQNASVPVSLLHLCPFPFHSDKHWGPVVPGGQITRQPLTFSISLFSASLSLTRIPLSVSACVAVCCSFSTGSGRMRLCRKGVLMESWPSLH